jgi:uncharacterized membrane protein
MIPMQIKNDCWWFGKTGKCYNFYILMAFVGFCTVTDIACLIMLVFSANAETDTTGGNSGGMSGNSSGEVWKNRYAVAAGSLLNISHADVVHARNDLPLPFWLQLGKHEKPFLLLNGHTFQQGAF